MTGAQHWSNETVTKDRPVSARTHNPQLSLIPLENCTTNGQPGYSPDDHLARLPPFLSGVCGPVRRRCSWQIHGGKWRTSLPARRFFGLAASASRRAIAARDSLWGGADLRYAEHQAESAFFPRLLATTAEQGAVDWAVFIPTEFHGYAPV